jgi:CheY-like chemotaxis protein
MPPSTHSPASLPSTTAAPTRELRDALTHLYDHAYLERHPLAAALAKGIAGGTRTRAQETRRVLLNAIELLNPGDNVGLRTPERRAYAVLFGLYVEGQDVPTVAQVLGISGRQLRRDRAAALEALAAILEDRYLAPVGVAEGHAAPVVDPLHQESLRLAEQQESVDLGDLAASLLPILDSLAHTQGVNLQIMLPSPAPSVRANPTLLRQILLSLASHAISHAMPRTLTLVAEAEGRIPDAASWRAGWRLHGGLHLDRLLPATDTLATLAAALGGQVQIEPGAVGEIVLWLALPQAIQRRVLVIDDNQDLLELFRRYLAGHPYQVQSASSVDEGLVQVRRAAPDAVVLDLMMPGRDGWELLAALRQDPALRGVPVIVCSVLHEPELAHALGAQRVLKKPVGATELLAALEAVLPAAWGPASHPTAPGDSAAPAQAATPPARST